MKNRSARIYILVISFLILVIFCIFFVLGAKFAEFCFHIVFGKPYEMGWLFLTFIGQIFALVFGFASSIISSVIAFVFIKKDYRKNKVVNGTPPWLIVSGAYLLFLVWLIILAIVISKATLPCANCYK